MLGRREGVLRPLGRRMIGVQAKAPSSWLKSGYGVAEVGFTAMEVMLQVYLLELYVSAGLGPVWAGAALAIAVLWDAVSDPLMGAVSDRTPLRSARGKRLSYFALGAPLSAVAFVVLFSPGSGASELALFGRLLAWYLILNTAMTLVVVPYLALINDLAKRADERAGFFGWRLFFSGAGLILGLSVPPLLAGQASEGMDAVALLENREGASVWIGAGVVLFSGVALAAVWRASGRAVAVERSLSEASFFDRLRVAWRSPAFRLIVGAFVCISMGRAINASLALIFYKGALQFSDTQVALALIGLSITVMAATPVWVLLSRVWGKRELCIGGIVTLSVLTAFVYPLMPAGAVGPVVFIVVAGGTAASSVVLLEALFSDVVEADSGRSRMDLNGTYYGLWRMATKVARAGGLVVSGLFLGALGYREGALEQSASVYRSVAWAFGPGVAAFFVLGAWLLWRELERSRKGQVR